MAEIDIDIIILFLVIFIVGVMIGLTFHQFLVGIHLKPPNSSSTVMTECTNVNHSTTVKFNHTNHTPAHPANTSTHTHLPLSPKNTSHPAHATCHVSITLHLTLHSMVPTQLRANSVSSPQITMFSEWWVAWQVLHTATNNTFFYSTVYFKWHFFHLV